MICRQGYLLALIFAGIALTVYAVCELDPARFLAGLLVVVTGMRLEEGL